MFDRYNNTKLCEIYCYPSLKYIPNSTTFSRDKYEIIQSKEIIPVG